MKINLTIPLTTLLGLTDHPGEATGFGPIDADLARTMAADAAENPAASRRITVTDQHGHPTAHGCAAPPGRSKPRRKKRPGNRPTGNGRPGAATRRPWRLSGTCTRHRAAGQRQRATRRVRDLAMAVAATR